MNLIKAIIRPNKLEDVKDALSEMMVSCALLSVPGSLRRPIKKRFSEIIMQALDPNVVLLAHVFSEFLS